MTPELEAAVVEVERLIDAADDMIERAREAVAAADRLVDRRNELVHAAWAQRVAGTSLPRFAQLIGATPAQVAKGIGRLRS